MSTPVNKASTILIVLGVLHFVLIVVATMLYARMASPLLLLVVILLGSSITALLILFFYNDVDRFLKEVEDIRLMQQRSEDKFQKIFHLGPDSIALVDLDGMRIIDVNVGFESIYKFSREQVIGKTAEELNIWVNEEDKLEFRENIRKKHHIELFETKLRINTGEIITALVSGETMNIDGVECLVTSTIDITDRKTAEIALYESQRKLRNLAIAMTEAEEKERRKIATNLHDHIAQNLGLIKLNCSRMMQFKLADDVHELMQTTKDILDETIESSRELVQDLSPTILYELGLPSALQWLADKTEQKYAVNFNVQVENEVLPLERELQVVLFKAANELMTNVCKHADSKQADIHLVRNTDAIQLTITDDGVGIADSQAGELMAGFGLFNIRENVTRFNGSLNIESTNQGGTSVMIDVPLHK